MKKNNFADPYYPLFEHLEKEHSLICLDSEMQEIIRISRKIETCEWKEDENGVCFTECGEIWQCNEGTPYQNGMLFCYHCGKKLKRIPYKK